MDILKQIHPGYFTFLGCYFLSTAGAIYASQTHSPNQLAAGFNNVVLATAVDYLLLSDVQRDIQQIQPGAKGVDADNPIATQSYMKRLQWAFHLCLSCRGVGWKHGSWTEADPLLFRGTESRRAFLISRMRSLILSLITLYVSSSVMATDPWFRRDAPSFSQQTMSQRCWSNMLFTAQFMTFLSICGNIGPGLVAVAMGWSEPRSWPPMFGSFSHAYTVRRFWRYTWHQMLRRIAFSFSNFCIKQIPHLQSGTKFSRNIYGVLVFMFSGALHLCTPSSSRPMTFFLLQPVILLAEEYVLEILHDTSIARQFSPAIWGWIGYVWVWCWFVWSSSTALDWWVKSGYAGVPMYLFNQLFTAMSQLLN